MVAIVHRKKTLTSSRSKMKMGKIVDGPGVAKLNVSFFRQPKRGRTHEAYFDVRIGGEKFSIGIYINNMKRKDTGGHSFIINGAIIAKYNHDHILGMCSRDVEMVYDPHRKKGKMTLCLLK